MAEGRMLKKRISKSRKFAALANDRARLLYVMMLPHLDVAGRLEATPDILRAEVVPLLHWTERTIQRALNDLDRVGLIQLYAVNGEQYLQFTMFEKYQRLNPDREAKSEIPVPDGNSQPTHGARSEESALSKVKLSKDKLSKVKLSKKCRHFVPPSLEQVESYISQNPELSNVNADTFWKAYATSDPPWTDTQGRAVRNWKLKLRTWSTYRQKGQTKGRHDRAFPTESQIGETIDG